MLRWTSICSDRLKYAQIGLNIPDRLEYAQRDLKMFRRTYIYSDGVEYAQIALKMLREA
jgi:hypothetical protein